MYMSICKYTDVNLFEYIHIQKAKPSALLSPKWLSANSSNFVYIYIYIYIYIYGGNGLFCELL